METLSNSVAGSSPDQESEVSQSFGWGSDMRKAKQRLVQIDLIWSAIEAANGRSPVWDESALEVAQAIAAGQKHIRLGRLPDERIEDFVQRVRETASRFPGLQNHWP